MGDFATIWKYVDGELKVPIEPYIKNVLMCFGFDNCYTIATIDESDLEHFQSEIRKGNLTKFYKNKTADNLLEGSDQSEKEFEFCLGHRKLILSIAKFVKKILEENGIDGFGSIKQYAETSKAKQNTSICGKLSNTPFKRQRSSPVRVVMGSTASGANGEPVLYPEHNEINADGEIAIHRRKLIKQALDSLRNDTSAMFEEHFATIQTSNLVTVRKKKEGRGYSAKIKCPYCKANITVFHIMSGSWNSSNFGRHLVKVHLKMPKTKITKMKTKKRTVDFMDSDSDDNIAIHPDVRHVSVAVGTVKDVISTTSSTATAFRSIVNYSDSDESEKDNENFILIEVPSNPMAIKSAIDEETFILTSNEPLESLEEISIRYPDSLYQSDSSKGIEEDFDEDKIYSTGAEVVPVVPILRNGYKSTGIIPKIYTVNTCGFDSVLSVYVCTYFDSQCYRETLELFVGQSQFSNLIKKRFDYVQSKAAEKMHDLYEDRNCILNVIFSSSYYKKSGNITTNPQYTFINCKTGIGGIFGQICTQVGENIASAIELKICSTCKTTTGKILPFFTIDYNNIDLRDIQKSISPELSKNRLCSTCKSLCGFHKIFNDIIVLEVEPNTEIRFQKTISIQNLTNTITITNMYELVYELLAVIEFDPNIDHFLSHVKRKSDEWKTYDDLKSCESDTNTTKEIYPFLLFFKQNTYHLADYNNFQTTLLSFCHNNKLRAPLVREILPSERRMVNQHSSHSAQASSKATSAERNKQLEMGWKY